MGKKKSPLINLCRLSTTEHLIFNHLFRGTKAIENAASWMKEVPIHNWNSKCSLCSDLRFYQAHGDACVVCGYMSSLQLGWRVWKWSQLLANVLTQILSLVGLRGTKNEVKVFKTLPPSALLWGKCQVGRRERRVRRVKPAPSRGPSRPQRTSAVTSITSPIGDRLPA